MSQWFFKTWPESIKKRVCHYLLQHYLGQFFKEKLTLDQLSVDLFSGTGQVDNVAVDINAINGILDGANIPFEVSDGCIGSIIIKIPWSSLWNDHCEVEIKGLKVTLQSKYKPDYNFGDTTDSLYHSLENMTTSMQLAEGCMKEEAEENIGKTLRRIFEGVEVFAEILESILSRMKITFTDIVFRIEHLPEGSEKGIGLEIRIQNIRYFDEVTMNSEAKEEDDASNKDSVTCKHFRASGIEFYLDEFLGRWHSSNSPGAGSSSSSAGSIPEFQTMNIDCSQKQDVEKHCNVPVLIAKLFGDHEVKLRIRQNEISTVPKIDAECFLGCCGIYLSPHQVHLLIELANGLSLPRSESDGCQPGDSELQSQSVKQFTSIKSSPTVGKRSSFVIENLDPEFPEAEEQFYSLGSVKSDTAIKKTGTINCNESQYSSSLYSQSIGYTSPHPYQSKVHQPQGIKHPFGDKSYSHSPPQETFKHGSNFDSGKANSNFRYQVHVRAIALTVSHVNPLPNSQSGHSSLQSNLKEQSGIGSNVDDVGRSKNLSENSTQDRHLVMLHGYFDACDSILSHILQNNQSIEHFREEFVQVCNHDHLRLIAIHGRLETEQRSSGLNTEITLGKVEFTECVVSDPPSPKFQAAKKNCKPKKSVRNDGKCVDHSGLLIFLRNDENAPNKANPSVTSPDIRVRINRQETNRTQKMSFHIHLAACESEVDISIVDRISTLLYPPEVLQKVSSTTVRVATPASYEFYSTNPNMQQAVFHQAVMDDDKEQEMSFNISASFLRINFRFPIADLRSELERRPWYKRSLREEVLVLDMHDIAFLTNSVGHSGGKSSYWSAHACQQQEFEITLKDLHVLYSDEPDKPKSFLHISQSPADKDPMGTPSDTNSDLDYPFIKITVSPVHDSHSRALLEDSELTEQPSPRYSKGRGNDSNRPWFEDNFPLDGSLEASKNANPTPFSQKKVIYDDKELVLPGDDSEMSHFCDHAVSTSVVSILIQLPAINVFLLSHSFFENLYNRINNDILLWAPAAPRPHGTSITWVDPKKTIHFGENVLRNPDKGLDIASQLSLHDYVYDDDDDDISICESDDTASCSRPSLLIASRRAVKSENEAQKKHSLISIMTKIGYGKITAECSSSSQCGTDTTLEHGEVVLMVENAKIFNVTSYCGDPLLDYVCVQITKFDLYHKPNIPSVGTFHQNIGPYTMDEPSHLDKVISSCDEGISQTFNCNGSNNIKHMLVLTIRIVTEEDKPMRRFLIAAGLDGVMVQYKIMKPGCTWVEQLIDFFDAADDQVLGYTPPSFVTEINVTVNNSAAAYRPLYMPSPISAVISTSSLYLSSNMVTGALVSVLDIIIDEAKLYITNQYKLSAIDLLFDYACVMEVNFLELCLKVMNENCNEELLRESHSQPRMEFIASNNVIELKTCADSCAALGALIRYLADDGDLSSEPHEDPGSMSDYQIGVETENANGIEVSKNNSEDNGDIEGLISDAMEDVYVDAESEFPSSFAKSSLSESMCNFSNKNLNYKTDPMTQSMMVTTNEKSIVQHRVTAPGKTSMHRQIGNEDLYLSAFPKRVSNSPEIPDDDGFCILDDVMTATYQDVEPRITYRTGPDGQEESRSIVIVDGHFAQTADKVDQLQAPDKFPCPVTQYTLQELSCIWYMYGGNDFQVSDKPLSRKNSLSSGSPSRNRSSPIQIRYNVKRGSPNFIRPVSSRDSTTLMEMQLSKIRARYEEFPNDTYEANRTVFMVSDFEIRDKLKSSNINKFLYRFHNESSPRQSNAKALLIKLLHVRPEGPDAPTECKLRLSLQPLRLNIDQDTLNFLTKFFSDIANLASEEGGGTGWLPPPSTYDTAVGTPSSSNPQSPKTSNGYASPVMSRPPRQSTSTGIYPDLSDTMNDGSSSVKSGSSSVKSSEAFMQPIFFREVVFSPEVPIRLDYHGKRIDTEQGTLSGLLMGLGQLNCSQLILKRLVHRHGLLGVDKLITFLLNEWSADIRANQLPLILGGVGPMHSVVQFFKGMKDLVYLPVEQYRKDGRLVRGIQRGATSFGTSTAMATLEISNRVIGLIQSAAETTYELVSPTELHKREAHETRNWRTLGSHAKRRQPIDIREGVSNAFTVMKDGVEDTAGAFIRVAQKEHDRKGVTAAVGGVLRHIPPALVKPVIMATAATTNVLSGIRNQIQPDAKQDDEDKWKDFNNEKFN